MNNIPNQLKIFIQTLKETELSSKDIALWAYSFSLNNKIYQVMPELDDVLDELSCMDADEDAFEIPQVEVIKMLEPFIEDS